MTAPSKYRPEHLVVCTVCLMLIANGEYSADEADAERAAEGMARLWPGVHLAPGDGEAWFSSQDCEGCGETLAGDRHEAFALIPLEGGQE